MTQVWQVAVVCLLVSASVWCQENQECSEAFEPARDMGLDYEVSLSNGAIADGPLNNTSDREACLQFCCKKEDCHLAIVGTPQDGPAQCFIFSCMKDGKDVCRMREMPNFTAYKKKQTSPTPDDKSADDADQCCAPKVVGPCRAAHIRFYYDVTNQTCQQFIYGGCRGNGNNFQSFNECKIACDGASGTVLSNEVPSGPIGKRMALAGVNAGPPGSPVPVMTSDDFAEQCQAKAETGPCRASMPRYFYNSTSSACQGFTYGGCKGNRNNYASAEQCLATCTVTVVPSGRKAPEENSSDGSVTSAPPSESCTAEHATGPCRGAFQQFYFSPATLSCLPFIYGGCRGNTNRYNTVDECLSKCTGKEGELDEHGQHRWAPGFFLVVTLAMMVAVVLVGLVLVLLRRMKFRRHARDDKEELLPEDQLATELCS